MRKIIKISFVAAIIGISPFVSQAQSLGSLFGDVLGKKSSNTSTNKNGNNNLSSTDISQGLKEALKIGAQNATKQLSSTDGFFKNAAVKILMPPEVKQIEQTLRSVGMGNLVDNAILAMNRAAEDAAKQAAPIFMNAITSITIQDGMNILKGGNQAATNYLKGRTTSSLTQAFNPIINKSLAKVDATRLWSNVFNAYNQIPFTKNKVNTDLTAYVTERALQGIFTQIAEEETKIRTNPGAQVSNILKKVFGQ